MKLQVDRSPRTATRRAIGIPASLSGGLAVAEAMRQTNPDVVAAYPITPSTIMVEKFSEYVADGKVDTEFLTVESEHSAMSACVGASAAGVRTQTVTSGQGLALMWEVLYVASGLRLPIVLHCANRALSGPLNIHCDHTDTMGARDAGWIQLYAENAQEAYDNALMSVRIAEHADVMLPTLHSQDGYTLTHGIERVEILPDDAARAFVGKYEAADPLLRMAKPVTVAPVFSPADLFELKRASVEAMERARDVIVDVAREFAELSGRSYGLHEGYQLDDADIALVIIGSTFGTARTVVDELRERGVRAGILKIRSFRPFPEREVAKALAGKRAVAVLERAFSFGATSSPLFADVCTALYRAGTQIPLVNYIYGIGGRDVTPPNIRQAFADLEKIAQSGRTPSEVRYLGLRE